MTEPYRWHLAGTAYDETASGGRQDARGTSRAPSSCKGDLKPEFWPWDNMDEWLT